jgi:hypothetical protein
MTRMLRNIIRGVSSVVEIAPPARVARIENPARHRSDADALRGDWQRVGDDIRASAEHQAARSAHEQHLEPTA